MTYTLAQYSNVRIDAPALPYHCPRGSKQIGTTGWLTNRGTLCGFAWDAKRFATHDDALNAAVAAGARDVIDFYNVAAS